MDIGGSHLDAYVGEELARTLVKLADNGTPSRIESLTVKGRVSSVTFLTRLVPAFQAGGLPRLTRLFISSLEGSVKTKELLQEWRRLGSKVKLETLRLGESRCTEIITSLAAAVADPQFLPFLWSVRNRRWNSELHRAVKKALERRWGARDAAAAAGGV